MMNLATRDGTTGKPFTPHTPLQHLCKQATIELGLTLGVDYNITVSCYRANLGGEACGTCDSCVLRKRGFEATGKADQTRYVS